MIHKLPLAQLAVMALFLLLGVSCGSSTTPESLNPTPLATPSRPPVHSPAPVSPTSIADTPSPIATEEPQRTDGAGSPEDALTEYYGAIEANDADAYLDIIDPSLRSNADNYFSLSQVLSALTSVFGLGSELGSSSAKVSFRNLAFSTVEAGDTFVRLESTGFVRFLAYAIEQPFSDNLIVREIGGRWFVSAPTHEEVALQVQATAQAEEQVEQLRLEQQNMIIASIIQQGEFVQVLGCTDWTSRNLAVMQETSKWLILPNLSTVVGDSTWNQRNFYHTSRIRLSPDGRQVAWQAGPKIKVMDLDGNNERTIYQMSGGGSGSFVRMNWAPDNRRLVVAVDSRVRAGLYTVDTTTGRSDRIWKGNAIDAVFMPDGQHVLMTYSSNDNGMISVYNLDTREERKLQEVAFEPVDLMLSPDAARVTFGGDGVWVMGMDGSELTQLVEDAYQPTWSPDGEIILVYSGSFDRFNAVGIMPSDGTSHPLYAALGPCTSNGAGWWRQSTDPDRQLAATGSGEANEVRSISLSVTGKLQGIEVSASRFEILEDKARILLSITNTQELGQVFFIEPVVSLWLVNQDDIERDAYRTRSITLSLPFEFPSTLAEGGSWEGWLETEVPLPPDIVGFFLEMDGIEYEDSYTDSLGNASTKDFWTTLQEDREPWYHPLTTPPEQASSRPQDPIAVVSAFDLAINARASDELYELFSEDATLVLPEGALDNYFDGYPSPISTGDSVEGREAIGRYFTHMVYLDPFSPELDRTPSWDVDYEVYIESSNHVVDGPKVTRTVRFVDGFIEGQQETVYTAEVIVEDGEIVFYEILDD